MNRKMTTGSPQLHPIPVKSPYYFIGIDFIGPLTLVRQDGSQYMLTMSDYFTKWVEAVRTPNELSNTVAMTLFNV